MRPVRGDEVGRFNACLGERHWLGHRIVGETVRCVVSSQRFCVLPEGRRPDLACAVLARALRRLPGGCRARRWRSRWTPESLRGAVGPDGRPVGLFAAMVHNQGVVVAQREVDHKAGEVTELRPLLEVWTWTGPVVTADALRAQRGHADVLVEQKARTVCSRSKATSRRPWRQSSACSSRSSFPPCHTEADRGHPRVERRSVQAAVTCAEQVGFGARSSGVLPSCVRCPTWTA
ncbi:MAG: hypothetical protein ACRDYX_11245, partial [Egibacteraceae bacterium]